MTSEMMINRAKQAAAQSVNTAPGCEQIMFSDFDVVWFCKTLQNFKVVLRCSYFPNFIWEYSYNGDKKEAYLDEYSKVSNIVILDKNEQA